LTCGNALRAILAVGPDRVKVAAYSFRRVKAVSLQGGVDAKHIEAFDYLLETVGPWFDV
jgi:hypothetical protein